MENAMTVPADALAQVYWRTCRDLRIARANNDGESEAAALYELMDLAAFTNRPALRAMCMSHVEPARAQATNS
jgi:hypothetical protein